MDENKTKYTQANFKTVEEYRAFVDNRLSMLKDKNVRRDVFQSTISGKKVPNPNGILNKWLEQACGIRTHFTNEPKSNLDIETMTDAYANAESIEVLAKGLTSFVFGSNNPDDYLSPKSDMNVGKIILPETPKSEKAPFFLSPQKLKEITTNPIVPICRKDDYLVLLGKDTKTNEAITFLMGVPPQNAFANEYAGSELSMYLYVGGVQPKYMGRTSYKPSSKEEDAHAQLHIENRKLCQNSDKELIDTFHTNVVHYHSYLSDESGHLGTIITNPRHYTALIKEGDNDYLNKEDATCQDAILHMTQKFNVLTPNLEKTTDVSPLPDDLTEGALVSLGVIDKYEDVSDIPLNTEMYDMVLSNYQKFIKTGERDFDPEIIDVIYPPESKDSYNDIVAGIINNQADNSPTQG